MQPNFYGRFRTMNLPTSDTTKPYIIQIPKSTPSLTNHIDGSTKTTLLQF